MSWVPTTYPARLYPVPCAWGRLTTITCSSRERCTTSIATLCMEQVLKCGRQTRLDCKASYIMYYHDRCRVQFTADRQGKFSFVTTLPGKYLLGYYYRPAHIHYRVTAPGYREVVTQLYFTHDDSLGANDPCDTCNSGSAELIMDVRAPTADDLVQIAQLVTFPVNKVVEFNPVMGH
ncbi:uncharacterized protein [Branchiostoma lanceolatum]|uniref:uncharacterized protein isoform X2 n=1 Tax=Branchiostoma lanceolatum TaxID=7740 RepID=UPI0034567785